MLLSDACFEARRNDSSRITSTEIVYIIAVTFAIKLITRAYDDVASTYEAIAKHYYRVSAKFRLPGGAERADTRVRENEIFWRNYVNIAATFLNSESAFEGNAMRATWRVRGRAASECQAIHHGRFCRRIAKYATRRHRASASGRNLHKRVAAFSQSSAKQRVVSAQGAIFLARECSWRSTPFEEIKRTETRSYVQSTGWIDELRNKWIEAAYWRRMPRERQPSARWIRLLSLILLKDNFACSTGASATDVK